MMKLLVKQEQNHENCNYLTCISSTNNSWALWNCRYVMHLFQSSGLFINGELFETNSSRPERPQAYFSRIAVISEAEPLVIFSLEGIITIVPTI